MPFYGESMSHNSATLRKCQRILLGKVNSKMATRTASKRFNSDPNYLSVVYEIVLIETSFLIIESRFKIS